MYGSLCVCMHSTCVCTKCTYVCVAPYLGIGFLSSSYNVSEDSEGVGLEIGLLSGTIDESVVVVIRTIDGTAVGMLGPV